tara:strand:- start:4146 stop:4436 length:291 start_codon:yes stop_codon:yes gene_type:complete
VLEVERYEVFPTFGFDAHRFLSCTTCLDREPTTWQPSFDAHGFSTPNHQPNNEDERIACDGNQGDIFDHSYVFPKRKIPFYFKHCILAGTHANLGY